MDAILPFYGGCAMGHDQLLVDLMLCLFPGAFSCCCLISNKSC
jgi:hypothetical protein